MPTKIDQILEKVTNSELNIALIQKDVAQNTKDLSDHIKRTNLLEERINAQDKKIFKALIPINWIKITVKVGLVLGAFATIFFKYFN